MPFYVVLVKLLEGGRRDLQEGGRGRAQVMEQLQKAGGRSVGGYLTFGEYDAVEIVEAPNDDVMLRIAMSAPPGQVLTTTLKAFPFDQALKLVKK
jgi:uncharacterized protein with GYD domain